jgi:hypothetical protein
MRHVVRVFANCVDRQTSCLPDTWNSLLERACLLCDEVLDRGVGGFHLGLTAWTVEQPLAYSLAIILHMTSGIRLSGIWRTFRKENTVEIIVCCRMLPANPFSIYAIVEAPLSCALSLSCSL